MARSLLPRVGVGVGAAALTFSLLMPTVLLPALKKIPLDAGGHTATAPAATVLFDAQAFAANTPVKERADATECAAQDEQLPTFCFIHPDLSTQAVRHIQVVEPSNKKSVSLRAGAALIRQDLPEPNNLIVATLDTVKLNRSTTWPVKKPESTFHATAPDLGLDEQLGAFQRTGLQYQFPFGAEQRSYPYFDTTAQAPTNVDYAGKEERGGTPVYVYRQQVGAVNMFDSFRTGFERDGEISSNEKAVLNGLRMVMPAGRWYSPEELRTNGLEPTENVAMTRYYAVDRTLWVEPNTGAIVDGQERLHYFFARSPEEAQEMAQRQFDHPQEQPSQWRTALYSTFHWDEDTQQRQLARAQDGAHKLWLFKVVQYVLGTIGAAALAVCALVLLVRHNRADNRPGPAA